MCFIFIDCIKDKCWIFVDSMMCIRGGTFLTAIFSVRMVFAFPLYREKGTFSLVVRFDRQDNSLVNHCAQQI